MYIDLFNFYLLNSIFIYTLNPAAKSSIKSREGSAVNLYTVIYRGKISLDNEKADSPTSIKEDNDNNRVIIINNNNNNDKEIKFS